MKKTPLSKTWLTISPGCNGRDGQGPLPRNFPRDPDQIEIKLRLSRALGRRFRRPVTVAGQEELSDEQKGHFYRAPRIFRGRPTRVRLHGSVLPERSHSRGLVYVREALTGG